MFELELRTLLILIPALPLLSAIVIALLGPGILREKSHWVTIGALVVSLLCSLGVVADVLEHAGQAASEGAVGYERIVTLWTWVDVANASVAGTDSAAGGAFPFRVDVTLRADSLTAMMLLMVLFIATLVAIYAAGYMHDDPSYWRFFAYVSLFVFSMTMLVLVSNFLLLYVFWEAVGVCSYLLIGFWYHKPAAAAAGKKAFLVNRVGDFGFALALFLIWTFYGTLNYHDTESVAGVLGPLRLGGQAAIPIDGGVATAICCLLLVGACGKSAQLPLHVWLPDAMEGPTPVSALIHAATMVTAGVYLVARCMPLFALSPDAQLVVACVGGMTALFAALIALTQFDLKRVLAYSTISQLGFMFLALGMGTFAGAAAAMFHLLTHAFFKALLFLGAGSVMHAMGNVIDMRRFGGLRQRMPWTHRTFLVGCLALAGVFPFAGFWSKDQVLASVYDRLDHHAEAADADSTPHGMSRPTVDEQPTGYFSHTIRDNVFIWLYRMALLTAMLTAFYTFRAYFMTFFGKFHVPAQAGHHAHESPAIMWGPLAVLALCAFGAGFVFESGHRLADYLASTPSLAYVLPADGVAEQFQAEIAISSTLLSGLGIGLAAFFYLGRQTEVVMLARLLRPLRTVCLQKFWVDELYQVMVVGPLYRLGQLGAVVDRWIVDGAVNLIGNVPLWAGRSVRRAQTGLVPMYGLMMAFAAVVVLAVGGWLWLGG